MLTKICCLLVLSVNIQFIHAEDPPTTTTTTAPSTSSACDTAKFKCDENSEDHWFLPSSPSMLFSCGKDKICNIYRVETTVTGSTTKKCSPCLPPDQACADKVVCDGETNFMLEGDSYPCPDKFICNVGNKHGCTPCYKETCDDKAWSCDGPTPQDVKGPNFEGKCTGGSICKKEKIPPCNEMCEIVGAGRRSARGLLKITKVF